MGLRPLSEDILSLYEEMAKAAKDYQTSSGLSCLEGCGRCCLNPQVDATVYEMLPMAFDLIDQNLVDDEYLLALDQSPSCLQYRSIDAERGLGFCQSYKTRPSLCRLFGASATHDKNKNYRLVVCKSIKDKRAELYSNANPQMAPLMEDWVQKLYALHPQLGGKRWPINVALKMAIEKAWLFLQYDNALHDESFEVV